MANVDREHATPLTYDVAGLPYIKNGASPGVNHPPIANPTKRKFKLLMDAHVPRKLSRFLRNDGHDVVEIIDVNTHLPDTKIVELSNDEERIIVSADSDFGCLVFKHGFNPHGVIYIKFHPLSRKKCRLVFDRIIDLLESVDSLEGKIATITAGKIRVTNYHDEKKRWKDAKRDGLINTKEMET